MEEILDSLRAVEGRVDAAEEILKELDSAKLEKKLAELSATDMQVRISKLKEELIERKRKISFHLIKTIARIGVHEEKSVTPNFESRPRHSYVCILCDSNEAALEADHPFGSTIKPEYLRMFEFEKVIDCLINRIHELIRRRKTESLCISNEIASFVNFFDADFSDSIKNLKQLT